MKKLVSILLVGVVAITLVFSLSACSGSKTMDLNQYFGVKFNGLDSMGTAEVVFDRESFNTDFEEMFKKQIERAEKEGMVSSLTFAISSARESISGNVDKSESLSNGDKVVLTISYDEKLCQEAGIQFKSSPVETEVIGLKEGKKIDAFEGITVQFSGVAPYAKAVLNKEVNNDNGFEIKYSLSKNEDLKLGEKVVVKAEFSVDAATESECVINETEKEFTVEGVPQQIESAADISGDKLSNIRKEADAMAKEYFEGRKSKDNFSGKGAVSMYPSYFDDFGKAKSVTNQNSENTYLYVNSENGNNLLIFRYTFDVNDLYGENYKNAFSFIYVDTLYIDKDGTVKYEAMGNSQYAFTNEADYEEYLKSITTGDEPFNFTKTEIK